MHNVYGHYMVNGKPLLIIGDAVGLMAIAAAWLGILPVIFTVFATFWASCYYLAMFYQSDLRKDLWTWMRSIRANKWIRSNREK